MSDALLHATAVSINGYGVLLLGPSAAGKSDLALRLIDRGAMLISDDAVPVVIGASGPELHSARNIEGRLEVRGRCKVHHGPVDSHRVAALIRGGQSSGV